MRATASHCEARSYHAAAAPAASLPPLPPSKPCAEVADPPAAALREVVALPPSLDAKSTKRRVNVAAPFLRATRPGLFVAPEPARHLQADPRQCPRAHALLPGGPVGAPDPRVSVRARNYFTGTQRLAVLRPSSQRHRAPVLQPNHAHEDHSPTQPLPGCPPPPPHVHPKYLKTL